jgi:hypothetical protein
VHTLQEANIEIAQARICGLNRPSAQVDRKLYGSALKLTIVKQSQAWAQEGQYRGGLMYFQCKCRSGARLVVVLKKARGLLLKLSVRPEMVPHGTGMSVSKSIIESLIVRVVKALLLECPFTIPVNFRHE